MTNSAIIAIDGPAGAGKSTVTRQVAKRLGLVYLDTGAMYRAVTWLLQSLNLPAQESKALEQALSDLELRLEAQPQGDQLVWVNGKNVTEQIRTAEITAGVSAVAALPSVRNALTAQQRRLGALCQRLARRPDEIETDRATDRD
jgi:pantoate ligase/cytidylate kinase